MNQIMKMEGVVLALEVTMNDVIKNKMSLKHQKSDERLKKNRFISLFLKF